MSNKIIAWWGIPCKSVLPIFRELHDNFGRDVELVSLHPLPESRRRLNWTLPPVGGLPVEILDGNGWKQRIDTLVEVNNGLHLINGTYQNARVRHLARRLRQYNRRYGVIVEAPSNLETGWKRQVKAVLAPLVTPFRAYASARRAEFVLSQSGDLHRPFVRLGFRADRIFPFGYFPDYPIVQRGLQTGATLSLLCIGYLEPFKGQDILLRAIALLRAKGHTVTATVTGFGSTRQELLALCKTLGIETVVDFPGVVSNERLAELFAQSSALVAPGREEPWGIRVNEGLMAHLPVVVSDGVGAKELVEATRGGEVFCRGSPESLATALLRLADRLQSGDVQRALAENRARISPIAAAAYLDEVIAAADSGFCSGPPPRPSWL